MPTLILASTSPYRRELLARLGLPFSTAAPEVDERPLPGETPLALATRLARSKAERLAREGAVVIGADQVATLDGEPIGKPGHHAAALAQLVRCQGRTVEFLTAVAVIGPAPHVLAEGLDRTRVRFGTRSDADLDRYLQHEHPYDCAGSFKAEGLGITLLERIESTDPTGLLGLPLIWLAGALRAAGLDPLRQ